MNLRNSFPEMSNNERKQLARSFYAHFCDVLVESIKGFSISKKSAIERGKIINSEVLKPYIEENRSVLIVLGHYANWELMAISVNQQIEHQLTALYHPLKNVFFNKKIADSRSQYGTSLVSKYDIKQFFTNESAAPFAMVFIADQSPIISQKKHIYWTKFMNQLTPIAFGTEKYAKEYDLPVVFFEITKVRRGYYEGRFELLEENPGGTKDFEITEKHVRRLEQQIREDPRYYLWTHRRWKHKPPAAVTD